MPIGDETSQEYAIFISFKDAIGQKEKQSIFVLLVVTLVKGFCQTTDAMWTNWLAMGRDGQNLRNRYLP